MEDEFQQHLNQIIELQNLLKSKARELQDLLILDLGSSNPVIWANKFSKDELEEMRGENSRAYAFWGHEEEVLLTQMYESGIELFVIAQALGRTENSVRNKINRQARP